MIKNQNIAQEISSVMIKIGRELDSSLLKVRDNCNNDEFQVYKKAVGRIMGMILLDILNPLYDEHPNIKPDELD